MRSNATYLRQCTVLFADDESEIREAFQTFLGRLAKEVILAADGKEALELFEARQPDIVITDIKMPVMSGMKLTEKIRQSGSEVPIIIVTAHNEHSMLIRAIDSGVTKFIIKPVDFSKLKQLLFRIATELYLEQEHEKNTQLLEQYKRAVEESAIFSKTDVNGVITFVNEQFCRVSGFSREELIGQSHRIIRHPDMDPGVFQDLWGTITDKRIWKGILHNRRKDGSDYYVDSTILPIVGEKGEISEST